MILGGGPNRIGQGIEFDYCCCHAAFALARGRAIETIMVNCNPETVSTDPDTSDRLYFEPLTAEDVLEIVRREQEKGELLGVIVQLGGQTPLKLAAELQAAGRADPRHLARQHRPRRGPRAVRRSWSHRLGLKQPANGIARSRDEALRVAERIGYPVLLRPSYVLGGRAMEVVDGPAAARPLYRHRGRGVGLVAGADRPLSARRDRGRRRRDLRRQRRRGLPECSSISRKPGSIRATAPARSRPTASIRETVARDRAADPRAGAGAQGQGADERPVRGQGRRGLSDRGQSARQPDRAVRRQGDRPAGRQDRGAGHGGRGAERASARSRASSTISRSRKRCSPSRASRGPTRCSDRK